MLIIFGEACKLWSSSSCSLLQYLATSSFLGPNILLSILFSDTLYVRDQIFYPDRTISKSRILYVLIFYVLSEEKGRQMILSRMLRTNGVIKRNSGKQMTTTIKFKNIRNNIEGNTKEWK
jgi:hypothetical protein